MLRQDHCCKDRARVDWQAYKLDVELGTLLQRGRKTLFGTYRLDGKMQRLLQDERRLYRLVVESRRLLQATSKRGDCVQSSCEKHIAAIQRLLQEEMKT